MNPSAAKPQSKIKKPRIDPPLLGRYQTSRNRHGYRGQAANESGVSVGPFDALHRSPHGKTSAFIMHIERELLQPVHLGRRKRDGGGLAEDQFQNSCFGAKPVAIRGIAFLSFIGVLCDRLEELEDRFLTTVFLGSEFLFLAMLRPGQKVGKKAHGFCLIDQSCRRRSTAVATRSAATSWA